MPPIVATRTSAPASGLRSEVRTVPRKMNAGFVTWVEPAEAAPFAPCCQRVDVRGLLDAAETALKEVERLGPGRLTEFDWHLAPKVRLL